MVWCDGGPERCMITQMPAGHQARCYEGETRTARCYEGETRTKWAKTLCHAALRGRDGAQEAVCTEQEQKTEGA